ncbi:hypothetical protein FB451DRAFT_1183973 [Mycena latifolia]|nr:hypothetical protein FB451DRAFT_1183973 [Mycena latifolia]
MDSGMSHRLTKSGFMDNSRGYADALNFNYVSVGYKLNSGLFNSSHLAIEDQDTNHIVNFQSLSRNHLANVQVSNMVQINLKELTVRAKFDLSSSNGQVFACRSSWLPSETVDHSVILDSVPEDFVTGFEFSAPFNRPPLAGSGPDEGSTSIGTSAGGSDSGTGGKDRGTWPPSVTYACVIVVIFDGTHDLAPFARFVVDLSVRTYDTEIHDKAGKWGKAVSLKTKTYLKDHSHLTNTKTIKE